MLVSVVLVLLKRAIEEVPKVKILENYVKSIKKTAFKVTRVGQLSC